jgi:hypothetical protein
MFDTVEAAVAAVRKLTDDQLGQLATLAVIEFLEGRVTEDQMQFVSAVIVNEMIERALAAEEVKAGATVH